MPEFSPEQLEARKQAQRKLAYASRRSQLNKDTCSRQAIARLKQLEAYQAAETVMWYVDARSELRTRWTLPSEIADKQSVIVPYCTEDAEGQPQLGLTRLHDMQELVEGMWQILEPTLALRSDTSRQVDVSELDFIVVPGVGFSPNGTRLGNGQGYYDRLLCQVREDCMLCGLCYESQVIDDLVCGPHDVRMDCVVTESRTYR